MRIKKLRSTVVAALFVAASAIAALHAADLRYIFYFIGDGMGLGHVMATEMYRRTLDPQAKPLAMTGFPAAGQVITFSASSPVTDSAAAGTALAAGVKTRNGMVGMAPDTTAVSSLASWLMERGYGIAVVTSNSPDDATPAAFYAHSDNRRRYYDIDCQAAVSSVDFLAGANLRGMYDANGNLTDLPERFARTNTAIAYGPAELDAATASKAVLLNTNRRLNNTLGYAIDSLEQTVTLPEMTAAGLKWLERHTPDRFFMMVENGMTDWASHGNDAGTLVREVIRLNEAIEEAVEFYLQHPDETLIVVTADHDTGGVSVGNANPAVKYDAHLELLALQRVSKDAFSETVKSMLRDRRVYSWDDMADILRRDFGFWNGVNLTDEETLALKNLFEDVFGQRNSNDQQTLYANYNAFAVKVFEIIDSHAGIGWISTYHTGNMVPVYALGVGAERFGRHIDNTDIPKTIISIVDEGLPSPPMLK